MRLEPTEGQSKLPETPPEDKPVTMDIEFTNAPGEIGQSFQERVLSALGFSKFLQQRATKALVNELIYREEIDHAAHMIETQQLSLQPPEARLFGDLCANRFFREHRQEWQNHTQNFNPKDLEQTVRFDPKPAPPKRPTPQEFDDLNIWLKRAVNHYLQHQETKRITNLSHRLQREGLSAESKILVTLVLEQL